MLQRVLLAVVIVASWAAGPAAADPKAVWLAAPRLGMNLSAPVDWNTELPFVDVFRLARPWVSQRRDAAWGQGPALSLDDHGWVTRLEPECWAETLLCTIPGGHYPGGDYTVLYDGTGTLEFRHGTVVLAEEPGRLVVRVDPVAADGPFAVRLTGTDPADYVRNIRVILPGFEGTYRENPWHPLFLARWRGVACLRFMDWMQTNASPVRRWADRPTPADATFAARGVPLEWMLDLCARLAADAWFCMPHAADDDFVRRFAALVRDGLAPGLKAVVEYSNEVWNPLFAQHAYAVGQATARGLAPAGNPGEAAGLYYARRAVEVFALWENVFGGHERLVRVLAWQAGNQRQTVDCVLRPQDAFRHADALAVAPYLGMHVPAAGADLTASRVAGWTTEAVLAYMEEKALPAAVTAMRASKAAAARFGLPLIAYEGGQHMVGVAGGENHAGLIRRLLAANAHPAMERVYRRYFDTWGSAGGGLLCHYASVANWSKWGSWGLLRFYDDPPQQAPKYRATVTWARRCGQAMTVAGIDAGRP